MKTIKKYLKYSDLAVAALALISVIMLFVPAISYGDTSINGFQAIFGYSENIASSLKLHLFDFSFMNFVTFLLTLAVIGCSVFAYVKKCELCSLISAALSLLGAVFFLLMNVFAARSEGIISKNMETSLSAGPIIAAILLFLAVGVFVAKKLLDK